MKRYLYLLIIATLVIGPIAGAASYQSLDRMETSSTTGFSEFTHTVMVEYGTLTTCGPCVTASAQLYSIYESGDLDFYYVSLVWDEGNQNVRQRLIELGVSSVPDVESSGKPPPYYVNTLKSKTYIPHKQQKPPLPC